MMATKRTFFAKYRTKSPARWTTTVPDNEESETSVALLFLRIVGNVNLRNRVYYGGIDFLADASGIDEAVCLD